MAIDVRCPCGQRLTAPDEFAAKRAECPYCGRELIVPSTPVEPASAEKAPGDSAIAAGPGPAPAIEITEFLDPPARLQAKDEKPNYLRRMFEALLAPQSIQWMLILGGGLTVLGLIVWLTSLGIFKNPYYLAVALGVGSLAILGTGWWTMLKTRFRVVGQAVTFLGCVVAPLNLWFYQDQGLLMLDRGLWVGGAACCLLYIATVYVLRDPLFMYAVEAGVTLTAGLLLAALGRANDTASVSMVLMVLGLASIHAERAFSPHGDTFTRRRFGLPLFWSGHVQLAASLIVLLATQAVGWTLGSRIESWLPQHPFLSILFGSDNWLIENQLLTAGLWLAATYAYLYSDLVVRRAGIYTYLAAICFVLAELTVAQAYLPSEGLIALLALTALAVNMAQRFAVAPIEKINRAVPPLAMALSCLPILIGLAMHVQATSALVAKWGWGLDTGWPFVVVMALVAVCTRISAWLCRHTAPRWSAAYFSGSAAAVVVAAAGLLRMCGLTTWTQQAPWLMPLPIGYLLAARLWRGHSPERPLGWVAQACTAVILLGVLVAALSPAVLEAMARPGEAPEYQEENLFWGLVFAEAAMFYALAAMFRRRSANSYLAAVAACAAVWQFLGYWQVPAAYHAMLYAILGTAFLVVARVLGIEQTGVYRDDGEPSWATRGRGLAAFQVGSGIVSVALLVALLQGLSRLATHTYDWPSVIALLLTTLASVTAIGLVPSGAWRRWYVTCAVAMAGLTFLTLTLQVQLTPWQKAEIFCVVVGVLMIAFGYAGRFRETGGQQNDMVTLGLFLGSALATIPLLAAAVYYHFYEARISYLDVWTLLTISILMLGTGFSWQVKSTTVFGCAAFTLYLAIFLIDLSRLGRMALGVGVYLAIAGALVFSCGIALSVYRERLLTLPDQIAKREGLFKVLSWR